MLNHLEVLTASMSLSKLLLFLWWLWNLLELSSWILPADNEVFFPTLLLQSAALCPPPPTGWRCSVRWWTRRSTTSCQPSPSCGGNAACSGSPSSSAVRDTRRSTDVFAPAGTSSAARWRCAETVYSDRRCERLAQRKWNQQAFALNPTPVKILIFCSCTFKNRNSSVTVDLGTGISSSESRLLRTWTIEIR